MSRFLQNFKFVKNFSDKEFNEESNENKRQSRRCLGSKIIGKMRKKSFIFKIFLSLILLKHGITFLGIFLQKGSNFEFY